MVRLRRTHRLGGVRRLVVTRTDRQTLRFLG